ncbi:hypothetical protein SMICM17S_12791 [Streptomyces microflavus]
MFLALVLLPVPLLVAALPAAFAGGGTRRWFGGRGESQRAEAQAARDAAAEAFYELDTAQRDLKISIETINAVDNSSRGRKAAEDFAALGGGSTTSATPTSPPSTPTTWTGTIWSPPWPPAPAPS